MRDQAPTIIVPVYNAAQVLEACLESLISTIPSTARVLLVDDGSTDPVILPLLTDYASKGGESWRVLKQAENQGFVATANHGMQSCRGDVILLNSDTLPAGDWFLKLRECASSVERLATATPWTNNGEIASLPEFCTANPLPPDAEALAYALGESTRPRYPEIPTAVGFCMYITRKAIDSIGYFDVDTFGQGYGEENDFSMRARQSGFRNVLCDNAWVGHVGNQSFGPKGLKPGIESMQRLLRKHPDYMEIINSYIREDPLQARRLEILEQLERDGVAVV